MSIEIKRLSDCSLQQVTDVWNEGFSDYYVQMTFTVEMFTNRFANDEMMPTRSVVAFMDGRPVGVILNGFRMVNGRKVAWNGGTCVAPAYRRYGVGKVMMDAVLDIYREEGVQLATLEAFKQNERAIALYEQKGYKIVDDLHSYERKDVMPPIFEGVSNHYQSKFGLAIEASRLPFYNNDVPWQSHWTNLRAGGESIIIMDGEQPVGYLLCRRMYDENHKLKDAVLYQCQVDPARSDREDIVRYGLSQLFSSDQPIARCVTVNTLASQPWVTEVLKSAGFHLRVEQVYMTREL